MKFNVFIGELISCFSITIGSRSLLALCYMQESYGSFEMYQD